MLYVYGVGETQYSDKVTSRTTEGQFLARGGTFFFVAAT
jgi:hypothetical protein